MEIDPISKFLASAIGEGTDTPSTDDAMRCGRILVVDDEPRNRILMEGILGAEGHVVIQAEGGHEALEIIQSQPVDIVLLDLMMPGMDGVECCQRIREDLKERTLPVVFVTAVEDREARITCKSVGADEFLTKPVDRTELLARIRVLLRAKSFHDLQDQQRKILERGLDEARRQTWQASRLALLGTLAAGAGDALMEQFGEYQIAVANVADAIQRAEAASLDDLHTLQAFATTVKDHAETLLECGRPGPDRAELVDMRDVVDAALYMMGLSGKSVGIKVRTEFPPEPVLCTVNPMRIEQVISNLVTNAVDSFEFRDPGTGQITVVLDTASMEGRVRLTVRDNGPGIAPELQERVFEPYYTTKSQRRGSGLGLCVVKQIVESCGGSVQLVSTPGVGTTVGFDLPKTAD